ncbi:MAG TPA: hypothetical protein PLW86_01710, partial [Rhodocyclaceae bacterium]|nr:hypothetical protein [Rhodocyclaceae bacterium]
GLAGTLLLGVGGCTKVPPGERQQVLMAITNTMLQGALPPDAGARQQAIARTVGNINATIAGLPLATQAELDQLFGLLTNSLGRMTLAGIWSSWESASVESISAFLDAWRHSRFNLLRSAYNGLHDLTLGAWYAEPDSWPAIGYPGPPKVR